MKYEVSLIHVMQMKNTFSMLKKSIQLLSTWTWTLTLTSIFHMINTYKLTKICSEALFQNDREIYDTMMDD